VTGDSQGFTTIWDKESGNQVKSFKDHQGDVLTITVNTYENCVYSSGVDSKISCFQYIKLSSSKTAPKVLGQKTQNYHMNNYEWVLSGSTRGQSHDVKSLVYLEGHNCLISGGEARDLCIYQLEKHGKLQDSFKLKRTQKKYLHIPPFELKNQVTVCTDLDQSGQDSGIMVVFLRKTFSVEIWMYEPPKAPVYLLEFSKREFGITSFSANKTASFVCISDIHTCTFYKVVISEDEVKLEQIKTQNGQKISGVIHSQFLTGK
jgi:WD40 repeat protein